MDKSNPKPTDLTPSRSRKKTHETDSITNNNDSESDEQTSPLVKKKKIKVVLSEKSFNSFMKGKMIVEDEEHIDEEKKGHFKLKKFQILKDSLKGKLAKAKLLSDKIDYKLDKAVDLYPDDNELKMIINKRNRLFCRKFIGGKKDGRKRFNGKDDRNINSQDAYNASEDAYNGSDDIWIDNGKSIVPYDDPHSQLSDSSSFMTFGSKSVRNETESLETQFYGSESKLFSFDEGILANEFEMGTIEKDIELVENLGQVFSPRVDISSMLKGVPTFGSQNATTIFKDGIFNVDQYDKSSEYGMEASTKEEIATKYKGKYEQPMNVMFFNDNNGFYERKVKLHKPLSENEKKIAEFIWRASNDGSDIVFKSKELQVQSAIFESLFPCVQVASGILDIWSFVLNHEEKYRSMNSGGGNIYCGSGMMTEHLVEADLIRKRRILKSNLDDVLAQSPYKSFFDVNLVFFPLITTKRSNHFYLICFNMKTYEIEIIDNLNNDEEDISERYGELPIYLIHTFIDYLRFIDINKSLRFDMKKVKIIKMKWRTKYNGVDCGIFVMRHMETYLGDGLFLDEMKNEGGNQILQLRVLRVRMLTKILMLATNEKREKLMKEADLYAKRQMKIPRIIKDQDFIFSTDLWKKISERVSRILDV